MVDPGDFIIALVPDPVHTHLALTFDRTMDVIQEALQDEGYTYVRSVMPWDATSHQESDQLFERLRPVWHEEAKQEQPGLMVFRAEKQVLFVLVVSESPTGGINKPQFQNAIERIQYPTARNLRPPERGNPAPDNLSLRILGPTFSGSLQSLAQLLQQCSSSPCHQRVSIHSGSVSGDSEIVEFTNSEERLHAHFVTFQESDKVMIERFVEYLTRSSYGYGHYDDPTIALVSEDETAYGRGDEVNGLELHLYFPREISQLRAAYQKEVAAANIEGQSAPRDVLPSYGDVSGDDSVTGFSSRPGVLSQEAVMQGLVAELKRHRIQFVIVRATDPMDTLFVSRYVHKTYPGARVVTIGADMLFRREVEDRDLHGLLSLSTYSMAPTANHGFASYEESRLERVFPSSSEAGTYNAMRSLNSAWADESSQRADGRIELRSHSATPFGKSCLHCHQQVAAALCQYGWRVGEKATATERKSAADYNAPPVRLLALGRDDYWPVASLGPYPNEPPSRLPVVAGQILKELEPIDLPASWRAVQLVSAALALAYCLMLWSSSVFSHWPALARFAPAYSDSRATVIFVGGLALTLIITILLWPFFHGVDRGWPYLPLAVVGSWHFEPTYWVLVVAGAFVALTTIVELLTRGKLPTPTAAEQPAAAGHAAKRATAARGAVIWLSEPRRKCWFLASLFVVVASVFLYFALGDEDPKTSKASLALLGRFATLRATRLTSGLSFIMPIFFFLGVWLWWSRSVAAGYTFLDERRPRLPKDMGLGKRMAEEFQSILKPGFRAYARYLALLLAIGLGLSRLVEWKHLSLERSSLEWPIVFFWVLAMAGVIGSTLRLLEVWAGTRRMLQTLDSQPLRSGFSKIEGLSWKPIWRSGAGTMAEFQRILARELEALSCATNTVPELAAEKEGLECEMRCIRAYAKKAQKWRNHKRPFRLYKRVFRRYRRPFPLVWFKRRETELVLVRRFGGYRERIGKVAGIAFDYMARHWSQQREEEERVADATALRVRACERFVCLVYVNVLLAALTRIRSLIVAIGGMYVLILIGATQYLFEPRAAIQLLLAALLAYIVAVVGLVFAQIHRDAILSRLTDTQPGELGRDFWVRMASFVALPLFSLFASQFPSVNRLFYSLIRPAIEALNH
jgi:hypothetical protein